MGWSVSSPPGDLRAEARENLRDPVRWTAVLQLVKTVVAAVVAWVLAAQVFELPQAFLAPWSALLVVHATVYRTFSRGLRQVVGAVLGVLLAWAVGNALGLTTASVSILLVVGLLIGSIDWFRDETTAVAATGLIVLTTGFSTQDQVLVDRLFDTTIGIVVGLVVNMIVWPPLRDYSAARAIDSIDDAVGALLCEMAERLRGPCTDEEANTWVGRTREVDDDIELAWSLLRQAKESSRFNPRRAAKGMRRTDVFEQILRDNEQAVAETRSMARTLGYSIADLNEWDDEFRDRWLECLREAGEAIAAPDSGRVAAVRAQLNRLAHDLSNAELSGRHWPEYGALILALRNIVTAMDRVAQQNPVSLPRYSRPDRLFRG
jgi:uncharacterized membrane protein YgaE (UPF0421/DUF939 family)